MKPSAVEQVMEILRAGQDDDVSTTLANQAIKEGLVKHFSFAVSDYDDGDLQTNIATIYPTEMDETFKSPYNLIRPLIPEAQPVDGCVVTEWHFPEGKNSPAQIATRLTEVGFTWDKYSQGELIGNKPLFDEIKKALEGCAKSGFKKASSKKKKPAKPLAAPKKKRKLKK